MQINKYDYIIIGAGSAGQVLVKDDNNLLAWDFVDDIEIFDLKKILTDREIKKIAYLKDTLRPSEIKPDIYYEITELIEKD